jgi:hypothetical protein
MTKRDSEAYGSDAPLRCFGAMRTRLAETIKIVVATCALASLSIAAIQALGRIDLNQLGRLNELSDPGR